MRRIPQRAIVALLIILLLCPTMRVKAEWIKMNPEHHDIINAFAPTGGLAELKPPEPMDLLSSSDTKELNIKMQQYSGKGADLLVNRATTYYYYTQLTPTAKEIYDVLLGVSKDPVNEGNIGLMITDINPQGDDYYFAYCMAYRALCFDHPELFWLYSGEQANIMYASEAVSQNGFYFVYFYMEKPFADFETQMVAFNSAAERFLADINPYASEYEIVRSVHDKLIDLVNYNDPVEADITPCVVGQDLAHTAYGALVADSSGNPNYAVCDGYTLAMEYLLQQCGINAVFIGGMAGSDANSAAGHAWNLVMVDGNWYEVDSTWDDSFSTLDDLPVDSDDYRYYAEALQDKDFRSRLDHHMFLISTSRIQSYDPGTEFDYITKDQKYVLSMAGPSVRYRMQDDGTSRGFDGRVIQTAPVALSDYMK